MTNSPMQGMGLKKKVVEIYFLTAFFNKSLVTSVCDRVPGSARAVRLKSATPTPNGCPIVKTNLKIRYSYMYEKSRKKVFYLLFIKNIVKN